MTGPARDDPPAPGAGGSSSHADPSAYEVLAVEVPGMSVPQTGCDDTAVNPVLPAFITQVHCFGKSCPKIVE